MLNKVTLIGRLGDDVQVNHLKKNQIVSKVSMATTERWKNSKDEVDERTSWHNLTIWGEQGQTLAKFSGKGDVLYVEGKIQYNKSDDGENVRYFTDIVVSKFVLLPNERKGKK